MSTEAETTNALQLFEPEKFMEIIQKAPEALQANTNSVTKAKAVGQALLDTIEASGMSAELDAECNKYQVILKKTYDVLQDRRKPFTSIMDEFKKRYTSLEAEIDPKNPQSHYARIQVKRNEFAQAELEKQKEKERLAQLELAKNKERNDVRARVEVAVSNQFNSFLTGKLNEISALLNEATLEDIDTKAHIIINYPEEYNIKHLEGISSATIAVSIPVMYIKTEDVVGIVEEVKAAKKEQFIQQYTLDVQSHKESVSLRIAARRNELQELESARLAKIKADEELRIAKENADKAEQERLQKLADEQAKENARLAQEAEERKKEEELRLAQEAKEREEKAASEAKANQSAADMTDLFNATEQAAAPAPAAKEAYEIEVTNVAAYLLIAQFWFEKEGMSCTPEEIEKKTFKQMKTFCEKWALKNEEKIKSPYINYKEVAKATVKK